MLVVAFDFLAYNYLLYYADRRPPQLYLCMSNYKHVEFSLTQLEVKNIFNALGVFWVLPGLSAAAEGWWEFFGTCLHLELNQRKSRKNTLIYWKGRMQQ